MHIRMHEGVDPAANALVQFVVNSRVDVVRMKVWEKQFLCGYFIHLEHSPTVTTNMKGIRVHHGPPQRPSRQAREIR